MTIAEILSETPHWLGDGAGPVPEDFEKQSEDTRKAIESIRWTPGDTDALRVLAFARYVSALSETDIASRLTGDDAALADDVLALPGGTNSPLDEHIDQLIDAVLSGHRDSGIRPANINEGWLATVLELMIEIRPAVVSLVLARDWATEFTLRWLLRRWLTPEQMQRFANVLLDTSDARRWRAAAALLAGVARSSVLNGSAVPEFPGSDAAVLVAAGLVLTQLARMRFYDKVRTSGDAVRRLESLTESIASTIASKINADSDLSLLERDRKGDVAAVVGILLGRTTPASVSALTAKGNAVLSEFFRELKGIEVAGNDEALPYLSAAILPDLVTIWKQIGGDAVLFRELEARLHYDEYAYQFAFTHYLTDRRRAICLAALGAEVGALQSDELLLGEARALAARLHAMPAGAVQVIDDNTNANLAAAGVSLPKS